MILKHFETLAWASRPRSPQLDQGWVHLWRVGPGPLPPAIGGGDLRRARQIWSDEERQSFLRTSGVMRQLAEEYLDCDEDLISWRRDNTGETAFTCGNAIRFAAASSGDLGMIAVSRSRGVAIAMERIQHEMYFEELARTYLEPEQLWEVLTSREPERASRFFQHWTAEDALSQAETSGLMTADAILWSISPSEGYAAAVAAPDQTWQFNCWDW